MQKGENQKSQGQPRDEGGFGLLGEEGGGFPRQEETFLGIGRAIRRRGFGCTCEFLPRTGHPVEKTHGVFCSPSLARIMGDDAPVVERFHIVQKRRRRRPETAVINIAISMTIQPFHQRADVVVGRKHHVSFQRRVVLAMHFEKDVEKLANGFVFSHLALVEAAQRVAVFGGEVRRGDEEDVRGSRGCEDGADGVSVVEVAGEEGDVSGAVVAAAIFCGRSFDASGRGGGDADGDAHVLFDGGDVRRGHVAGDAVDVAVGAGGEEALGDVLALFAGDAED
mmetsp:Transcript_8096/g.16882  ORF Transcript_8096/g.16882 Transcript_8096/m.16882 type:complete len:280 (+) Transcript_8096:344-1183(+)